MFRRTHFAHLLQQMSATRTAIRRAIVSSFLFSPILELKLQSRLRVTIALSFRFRVPLTTANVRLPRLARSACLIMSRLLTGSIITRDQSLPPRQLRCGLLSVDLGTRAL